MVALPPRSGGGASNLHFKFAFQGGTLKRGYFSCFADRNYPDQNLVAALPKVNQDLDPSPSRFKGDNRPVEQVS
jgi:hypothetical protein